MSVESKELKKRRGGIDPAALAAASLAAAISTISQSGPYGPPSLIIGLTILILVLSYDIDPHRSKGQSWAFSAVAALIAILALGFPLECIFASDKLARIGVLLKEKSQELSQSEVPPIATIAAWLLLTLIFYWRDRTSRD